MPYDRGLGKGVEKDRITGYRKVVGCLRMFMRIGESQLGSQISSSSTYLDNVVHLQSDNEISLCTTSYQLEYMIRKHNPAKNLPELSKPKTQKNRKTPRRPTELPPS